MVESAAPGNGAPDPRAFTGLRTLLDVITRLAERPRRFVRRQSGQVLRGERALPLLCLDHEPGAEGFPAAVARVLDAAPVPQIPHTLVDVAALPTGPAADPEHADGGAVREPPMLALLDELAVRLAADRFGVGRVSRFDHYRLVEWLAGHRLPPRRGRDDRHRVMQLLRSWVGRPELVPDQGLTEAAVKLAPSGPAQLVLRLVLWLGPVLGFRWIGERVPGLAQETRWLMRGQPYMVPRHSSDFLGFAERLTLGERASENAEQLKKLLVHAFLEDLRLAYRRRTRRLLPRRRGWRHTSYVIALLDNVTADNEGGELLRLINAVRNETGEPDPLLVVADGPRSGSIASAFGVWPVPADEADRGLEAWERSLPVRRQLLARDARYVFLRLPPADAHGHDRRDRTAWNAPGILRPRRAPRLTSRALITAVVAVLVAGAAFAFRMAAVPSADEARLLELRDKAHCPAVEPAGVRVEPVEIQPGDFECVGYSDTADYLFTASDVLLDAQRRVFGENRTAREVAGQSGRPLLTVVYLAGLTYPEPTSETDAATAEELEGIRLYQRYLRDNQAKDAPLLRVVVANAGAAMARAPEVVDRFVAPLFRDDNAALAVLGLGRTVDATEAAITGLGRQGVPTITTSLTGTRLPDRSPLYFQLAPGNRRQADVLFHYARARAVGQVTLYYPDNARQDGYVQTLAEEVQTRFRQDPTIAVVRTDISTPPSAVCRTAPPGREEIAFYGGRESEFGAFLAATKKCGSAANIPLIVADDSVSRFVASRTQRDKADFDGLPIRYISMGGLVPLTGRSCVSEPPAANSPQSRFYDDNVKLRIFCSTMRTAYQEGVRTSDMPWPGERLAASFDSADLLFEAFDQVRKQVDAGQPAPHRAEVAQRLREPAFEFQGTTGIVRFDGSRAGSPNRSIGIFRLDNTRDVAAGPRCEYLIGELSERFPSPEVDYADRCPDSAR